MAKMVETIHCYLFLQAFTDPSSSPIQISALTHTDHSGVALMRHQIDFAGDVVVVSLYTVENRRIWMATHFLFFKL